MRAAGVNAGLPDGTLYRQGSAGGTSGEHNLQLTEYQVPVLASGAPASRDALGGQVEHPAQGIIFSPPIAPGHIDIDSAFIQKNQMRCLCFLRKPTPVFSLGLHIGDAPVRKRGSSSFSGDTPLHGFSAVPFRFQLADSIFYDLRQCDIRLFVYGLCDCFQSFRAQHTLAPSFLHPLLLF